MKNLVNHITEALRQTNNMHDIFLVAKVLLPGRKRKTGIECYNLNNIKENDTMLDYSDQIVFKYYCFYKWGVNYPKYQGLHNTWVPVDAFDYDTVKKNKWEFYFDNYDCVDGQTDENIEGVKCDGSLTFKEARELLENHFNV